MEATTFRMEGAFGPPDLWKVEQVLLANAKIAGRDKDRFKRR